MWTDALSPSMGSPWIPDGITYRRTDKSHSGMCRTSPVFHHGFQLNETKLFQYHASFSWRSFWWCVFFPFLEVDHISRISAGSMIDTYRYQSSKVGMIPTLRSAISSSHLVFHMHPLIPLQPLHFPVILPLIRFLHISQWYREGFKEIRPTTGDRKRSFLWENHRHRAILKTAKKQTRANRDHGINRLTNTNGDAINMGILSNTHGDLTSKIVS